MSTPRPSLRDSLADYLNLRRALGFQLANAGRLLEQFVGYLERHGIDTVTTEHAVRWATLPADASRHWLAIRVGVVRGFTVYLHSIDSSAGACRATPYLYSESEIGSLIQAAGALRPRLRAATYQSLISLLAISGIRIGEAIALDDDDFDVEHEVLVLHHTKFNKQRLVPLHPSATLALSRYVDLRQRLLPRPASPARTGRRSAAGSGICAKERSSTPTSPAPRPMNTSWRSAGPTGWTRPPPTGSPARRGGQEAG